MSIPQITFSTYFYEEIRLKIIHINFKDETVIHEWAYIKTDRRIK